MRYDHRRESAGIGRVSELIQVAGNAFELRHEIQMFPAHPLTHSSASDKLPNDFGWTAARCAG